MGLEINVQSVALDYKNGVINIGYSHIKTGTVGTIKLENTKGAVDLIGAMQCLSEIVPDIAGVKAIEKPLFRVKSLAIKDRSPYKYDLQLYTKDKTAEWVIAIKGMTTETPTRSGEAKDEAQAAAWTAEDNKVRVAERLINDALLEAEEIIHKYFEDANAQGEFDFSGKGGGFMGDAPEGETPADDLLSLPPAVRALPAPEDAADDTAAEDDESEESTDE